jgi:hypothetical protein
MASALPARIVVAVVLLMAVEFGVTWTFWKMTQIRDDNKDVLAVSDEVETFQQSAWAVTFGGIFIYIFVISFPRFRDYSNEDSVTMPLVVSFSVMFFTTLIATVWYWTLVETLYAIHEAGLGGSAGQSLIWTGGVSCALYLIAIWFHTSELTAQTIIFQNSKKK